MCNQRSNDLFGVNCFLVKCRSHFTCRIISVTGLRVCLNVFHSVIKRNLYCVSAIVLMRKGLFGHSIKHVSCGGIAFNAMLKRLFRIIKKAFL